MHLAAAAVVNAVWDLWAKAAGRAALAAALAPPAGGPRRRDRLPLHRRRALAGRGARPPPRGRGREGGARARRSSPTATRRTRPRPAGSATTTRRSRRSSRQALADGFRHIKMKVGGDLESDARRAALIRDVLGSDGVLMMDANQVWGVDEAIAAMRSPGRVRPLVDRGADEPGRRPRACPDPEGDRADPRRHRRARAEPRHLQAAVPGARRSTFARSTPAGSQVSTRCSRSSSWRRSSASPCARMRAASGSASTCNTSPSSTSSASAARSRTEWSSGSTICTSTSATLPWSRTAATGYRARPATASRCSRRRSRSTRSPAARHGPRPRRWSEMTEVAGAVDAPRVRSETTAAIDPRYRLLQGALLGLRAGPALILLILVVVVSLTTPVFFTSRNIGNVFSQTAVIAVLALGQLLVIVSRGIDLSVGSTVALSGVVGAIVFTHVHSTALVILAILGDGSRRRPRERRSSSCSVASRTRSSSPSRASASPAGLALWAANGTLIPGMPGSVDTLGGGRSTGSPTRSSSSSASACSTLVGTTYLVWGRWLYARRRQPRRGPTGRHSRRPRARDRLRAERPRGGRRRPPHRRSDRRGLADVRRPRRARLDRGGHHRRRGVRGRARKRRQRARRRVHDRRDPQRPQPPQRQRLLPADGDRRRRAPGRRGAT